jgi:hypothetical protein
VNSPKRHANATIGRRRAPAMTKIRAIHADGRASASHGRRLPRTRWIAAEHVERSRGLRDGSSNAQPSGRTRSLHRFGLDARRWRIWRNGTLAVDASVGGSSVAGRLRGLNRVRRFGDRSGRAGQVRQDGSSGIVRGLHGAGCRPAGRFVVHRAHGVGAVAASALRRMRVCRGDPQRDGHERHRSDLAAQPNRRDRRERPTQVRHRCKPYRPELSVSNDCVRRGCATRSPELLSLKLSLPPSKTGRPEPTSAKLPDRQSDLNVWVCEENDDGRKADRRLANRITLQVTRAADNVGCGPPI